MTQRRPKQIVILGGGFGGLYAALEFEKTLARDPDYEVTLVNRENFFLFTPLLHEVAASDLDVTHIVNPIRKMLRRVRFFEGDINSIDMENRRVAVSHGIGEAHVHELQYDCLVLALGSITNFFNLPGLAERALTMKSLGDAIVLRNRLVEHLEEADFECAADHRPHLLTFVVAGGGFAGVETIAGMNDFLRDALRFYPHLTKEMIRCVLVHPGEVILPELGRYAQKKLIEDGIEILVSTKVTGVSEREVTLIDGQTIESKTLIWTAGTSPNPILRTLTCNKDRGRIVVNEFMEVEGSPGVYALGDCAVVPDRKTGMAYPPTAQHALREGRVVARNVIATLRGGRKKPFTFTTLGQLASIGKRKGVAKMFGFHFSGFIAWWLWRSIYLSKLPRFEKKVRVALDWTLDILFTKDLVQFMTLRAPTVSHREDEAPTRAAAAVPN